MLKIMIQVSMIRGNNKKLELKFIRHLLMKKYRLSSISAFAILQNNFQDCGNPTL